MRAGHVDVVGPRPMTSAEPRPTRRLLAQMDISTVMAVIALLISGLGYYRSYIYTKQDLEITVTEVSYVTNQGELYITVAFSNGGNRDAAVLRIEPALWNSSSPSVGQWRSLGDRVHPNIPVASPKTPLTVKAGGVEVVTLATMLDAKDAEQSTVTSEGGAFLGIRVETMNSDGNLYLLEHAVARLTLDRDGHVRGADPAIHQTLQGFEDVHSGPPGDRLLSNKRTPFVWADQKF